ncbi:hypothetical protein WMF18_12790 [Sorangium sp. So ce315]|uniref:hypothetical protein n=1 Tax=Sorangium sp. So ce315 TaxID=3133299 RepID=UPI003F5F3928
MRPAHRTVWSLLAFAALTLATGQLRALVAALRDRRVVGAMAATGALVSANWVLFIYAVSVGRVLDASLGYFSEPFTAAQAVSFACIWTGLAVFSADAALRASAARGRDRC